MLHDDPEEAIGTLSSAIASGGHGDSELVAMLLSRSQAHFDLGHFEASRKDALVALCVAPDNPTATFRACEACVQLHEFREACAVLSAGASHANDEALYDFFCKRSRSLGAWRLPPPLDILPARGDVPADREVPRLHSPTRDQFAAYVKRHEPVVVSGFARPEALAEWSWEVLIDAARDACLPAADARSAADAKAPSGDVTITSTGCLPDYCRPESSGDDPANPLASRIELTHFEDLSVSLPCTKFPHDAAQHSSGLASNSRRCRPSCTHPSALLLRTVQMHRRCHCDPSLVTLPARCSNSQVPELLARVAFSPPGAPREHTPLKGPRAASQLDRQRWRDAALRAAAAASARAMGTTSPPSLGFKGVASGMVDYDDVDDGVAGGGVRGKEAHTIGNGVDTISKSRLVSEARCGQRYGGSTAAGLCHAPGACAPPRSWARSSTVQRRRSTAATLPPSRDEDGYTPCFDKLYAYGGDWMLTVPKLRAMATRTRPTFLLDGDYETGRRMRGFSDMQPREEHNPSGPDAAAGPTVAAAGAAGAGTATTGGEGGPPPVRQLIGSRAFVPVAADDDGAVCWVSSEGCLTPLHYDLDEGLLAQVMGEKRVWLYDYKDRGALYMRGDEGRERVDARPPIGLNNWERQSFADFHGGRRLSFPKALAAQRWRADLAPGDLLYIPAGWFHEVHSRTPSFSLGWRFGLPETADSEPELRRALEAKRTSLGPTHEETLDAAKSLSRLLYRQERFEEAEPLNRGVVDALRQRHGWQSEHAMMAVSNLGLIVARRGRLDDAATLLGEALSGLRSCDAEDPRLHSIAANLAEIRHMQGRLAEAEALYREAWAMRRKALGDVHPMTKQLAKLLASGPLQPME